MPASYAILPAAGLSSGQLSAPLLHWYEGGKFLRAEDRQIFFREGGTGDALVLLHGFPTSSWDWQPIWEELSRHFRVIAPDFFGFGFSDKPGGFDYSIMDQANWVEALLAKLGVRRVHLLAHDYGDSVAQELLARERDRIVRGAGGLQWESVALLNGGLFPEAHKPRPIQNLLNSPLGFLVSKMLSRERFGKSFSEVFGPDTKPSEEELDLFWELIAWNGGQAIAHRLIRYIRERKEHRDRWLQALTQRTGPLCLINGPEDPVSGRHLVARFRDLLPDAPVDVLEGIGHYPQVESPLRVVRAYLDFAKG